jgi:hypothetical protein
MFEFKRPDFPGWKKGNVMRGLSISLLTIDNDEKHCVPEERGPTKYAKTQTRTAVSRSGEQNSVQSRAILRFKCKHLHAFYEKFSLKAKICFIFSHPASQLPAGCLAG